MLLAVTSSDELNILSGLIAKRLGVRYTIARVRNPDYYTQLRFLREELGFNMILNPEAEAANEIVRSILFHSAMKVNTFARGNEKQSACRHSVKRLVPDQPQQYFDLCDQAR